MHHIIVVVRRRRRLSSPILFKRKPNSNSWSSSRFSCRLKFFPTISQQWSTSVRLYHSLSLSLSFFFSISPTLFKSESVEKQWMLANMNILSVALLLLSMHSHKFNGKEWRLRMENLDDDKKCKPAFYTLRVKWREKSCSQYFLVPFIIIIIIIRSHRTLRSCALALLLSPYSVVVAVVVAPSLSVLFVSVYARRHEWKKSTTDTINWNFHATTTTTNYCLGPT